MIDDHEISQIRTWTVVQKMLEEIGIIEILFWKGLSSNDVINSNERHVSKNSASNFNSSTSKSTKCYENLKSMKHSLAKSHAISFLEGAD